MAKISVAGNAVVVTSSLKLEDIKKVEKYRPAALTLMGGEDGKEPLYAIASTNGEGSINKNGASFGAETRERKLATLTMIAPRAAVEGDIKEYIADYFGESLDYLKELEESIPAVIEEIDNSRGRVIESISVVEE